MAKLSVCITTSNSAKTLSTCLRSVCWADEVIVLDRFSNDNTLAIAKEFQCVVYNHQFQNHISQKQKVLDLVTFNLTKNDWVLLLDANEALSSSLQTEIRALLMSNRNPDLQRCDFPKQDQLFWRMTAPHSESNYAPKLFRKSTVSPNGIETSNCVLKLKSPFYYFGEVDVDSKVATINQNSTNFAEEHISKNKKVHPLSLLFYPPATFCDSFFRKRNFLNGWAGFMKATCDAFSTFVSRAKIYEHQQQEKWGQEKLPLCDRDSDALIVPEKKTIYKLADAQLKPKPDAPSSQHKKKFVA